MPGVGHAGKAACEKVRPTHRLFVGARPRVRLSSIEAAGLRRERKLRRIGSDEIGIRLHAVIVGTAAKGVGVECEVAGAGIEQHSALATVVDARHGGSRLDARAVSLIQGAKRTERAAGQRVGNPVVGRTDDAADRLRAIAQCRRPADHLDLIRRQRVDRHEVVFAEVGHAAAAHAIIDDADAIDVEAADDRPARCAGRKARAGDARFRE